VNQTRNGTETDAERRGGGRSESGSGMRLSDRLPFEENRWGKRLPQHLSILGLAVFVASTSTSVVGQEIGLGLMLVGWIALLATGQFGRMNSLSIEAPVLALALAWTLSTIFAIEPQASLVNMKKLFLLPIVYGFAWLVQDRRTVERMVKLLVLVGALVSLYGIVTYFVGFELEEGYRVRATLSSTVTMAGVLLFILALSLSLALSRVDRRERLFFISASVLSFVCLLLTFTRGAWLGAIVSLLLIAYKSPSRGRRIVWGTVAILAAISILSPRVEERIASVAQLGEMSIAGRFSMWLSATEVAQDSPFFGVGLMDLGRVYNVYKRADSMFASGHMHSDFFHVLASTGIAGLLAFLWLLYSVCRVLVKNYAGTSHNERFMKAVCLGSLAGFCAFVLAGVFEWNFGDAEVVSTLYCLVGLSCACAALGRHSAQHPE
jgi:putative inorganic carbon (HCO3(-)) transporter